MKTIKLYKVEIRKDGTKEYEIKEHKVLLENEDYLVIDTFNFQSLRKTGRDKEIDTPIIFEMNFGFGSDGLFYRYHTSKVLKPERIRIQIEAYIIKKYGYLLNMDLNFIK